MLKRKRTIALLSSAIILANSTSGAINEFKVFAEDNIMPIVKENLFDSKNNESNITQPDNSGAVQLPENSGNSNDSGITVQPDNPGGSNGSDPTPLPLAPEVKLTDSTAIENNGIYYTNNGEIEFNFNVLNVDNITVEGNNNAFIWANSGVKPVDNKVNITLDILQPNKVLDTKIIFTSNNGDSIECKLRFISDTCAPTINFKKDENGLDFDENSFDKHGVYYLQSNEKDSFNLFMKIDDKKIDGNIKVGAPEVKVSTTDGTEDFVVISSILENGYYNFNISNIKENKENTLSVKVTDIAGNESSKEFKFFKDTAKAEVVISSNKLNYNDNKGIYYIKNDNSKDLVLNLDFNNVDNINVFSIKDILVNNINIPLYDKNNDNNELSMILSDIKNNKATLTLKNIPNNENLELKFTNLKDNDKDTVESTFKLYKDTIEPNISLGNTDNEQVTYTEGNTLYLKYDVTSTNLTIDNGNPSEDLLFSAVIKDKNGNKTSLSTIDDETKNVFAVNVAEDSINTVILTATDYSGNKKVLMYEIIQDSTTYSTSQNILSVSFSGKHFSENKLYLYDTNAKNHSFDFIFNKGFLSDNFIIYRGEESCTDDNIIKNQKDTIEQLSYDIGGNKFKYTLLAKNGSFKQTKTYTVFYTYKSDFSIVFLDNTNDNDMRIIPDGIYSDSNDIFDFQAKIIDAGVVHDINDIKIEVKYTAPQSKKTIKKKISIGQNSKFIKTNLETVLIGKKEVDANTYTLDRKIVLKALGFDNFKDGHYEITVKVDSKFNYEDFDNSEDFTTKSIEFNVDSYAPKATLVLENKNTGTFDVVNKNENTYINPNDVYIGINVTNENDISDKYIKRTISINGINYDINSLGETNLYDTKGNYKLYTIPNNKDIFISDRDENSNYFKDYKIDAIVTDVVLNKDNQSTQKLNYTIDTQNPKLEIYSDSKHLGKINLKGTTKENAPFINPENIMAIITNETNGENGTLNSSIPTQLNKFLWFDKSSNKTNALRINVKNSLNINSEGLYELQVISTDKAGNETTEVFYINVDTQKPVIDMGYIAKDKDKAFTTLNTLNVDINRIPFFARLLKNMSVSDTMNSEIALSLNLTDAVTNKKLKPFEASSSKPKFDISSVEDGIYNVVLTATDEAGNKSSSEGKITIDGSKPVVSTRLSTLKDSDFDEGDHTIEHKNVDSVTPVVTITDITTKPDDINIVLQGKTITVDSSNSSVDGYTRKITLPTISSEDVYDLQISVGDRIIRENIASRNKSVTKIGFGIDRTKPSLSVTAGGKSITEGSTTYLNAKDTMDLVAKVNDNILSDNELEKKTVITLNSRSTTGTKYTFNSDNTYNVNVTVTDNALNSNSLNFTIIVDTVIPKVTIEGVTEGKFLNKDITPTITTDDETAVETITLNNATYTKGTIINKDNSYSLVARAEDAAGNIGEASVNFVLDKTKPVINIKNIEENVLYTKSTLTSDIKASDHGVDKVIFLDNKATLIPDIEVIDNDNEVEKVIFLDNKEYTGGPIPTDGSHVLTVKAVDRASNTSQATIKFKTNFNPPTITVHSIKDNEIFTGPVKLNIEFGDTKLYHILINGKEYMNGDIISKPGKYKMEIIAIDEFGSESRQVINFTINEGVVSPSSVEGNGPTASTYKLIAVSIIAILTLVLFVVFSKISKPKNS